MTGSATISGRYELLEELGRGGAAVVYRARDTASGQHVALKRLLPDDSPERAAVTKELFEREYHTLAQLSHPRVVEVFSYGVEPDGAFYTMELLDAGDLDSRAPISYRQACSYARDVCSALSLIHSRRFVHRDVTPRNVRCTTNGMAKLIDFGVMVPMGPANHIVGTPPFCSPEVLNKQALDARTDLYSLGATLYFALCRRHAYPARSLGELRLLWQNTPPPPSEIASDVPTALDDLVMELIALEPTNRPMHTAEVWERLSTIAELPLDEQAVVAEAYLTTPTLVGCDRKLARVRDRLVRSRAKQSTPLLIEAEAGLGRSRFVDACALEASLLGTTVLRASDADAQRGHYGAVRALAGQLLDAHPELANALAEDQGKELQAWLGEIGRSAGSADDEAVDPRALQDRLKRWFTDASERQPLAIAIDNIEYLDEPSLALIALLAHASAPRALMIIATAQSQNLSDTDGALGLLARLSTRVTLRRLEASETSCLLRSMFGDVPHLDFLSQRLHEVSRGSPRDLMQLAHHLLERGVVSYQAGSWTLPRHINESDLPDSLAKALAAQVASLSVGAREVGQALALAPDIRWSLAQCRQVTDLKTDAGALAAIDELLVTSIVRAVGNRYTLAQQGWIAPLRNSLTEADARKLHARLARLFDSEGDQFRFGKHLMAAGKQSSGLDVIVQHARATKKTTSEDTRASRRILTSLPSDYREVSEQALALCDRLQRPAKDKHALRMRMSAILSALGHDAKQHIYAVIDQCAHDAGLDLYAQLPSANLSESERLHRALEQATARYEALPYAIRVQSPSEAMRPLVASVIEGLGLVSNRYDNPAWALLPSLHPLAPVSPAFELTDKVRLAIGHRLAGRYRRARELYTEALDRVEQPDGGGLQGPYYLGMRDGVTIARALIDVAMGSQSVLDAIDRLEKDAHYPLSADQLRMLYSLWQGDGEAADALRRKIDVARVKINAVSAYEGSVLFTELCALSQSDDHGRLRALMTNIERWARRFEGWEPMLHFARGEQLRIGGNLRRACMALEEGLTRVGAGQHQLWPMLAGAKLQCMLGLGAVDDAVELGRRCLQQAQDHGIDYPTVYIKMPLSWALCQCGDTEAAHELAMQAVSDMEVVGANGIPLGLAYHGLARTCIYTQDADGFEQALQACASVFKRSTNRALVTKYDRLVREARRAQRSGASRVKLVDDTAGATSDVVAYITTAFETCNKADERARVAATLLAEHCGAQKVFLYVPSETGVELSATVGCYASPPQLHDLVTEMVEVEMAKAGGTTITAERLEGEDTTSILWRSPEGENFYAVVLGHDEGHDFKLTGVAVLAHKADEPFSHPGWVTNELSRLGLGAA